MLEVTHEIRSGVVYVQCENLYTRTKEKCQNLVPLTRFGSFTGKCGVCGTHLNKSFWWLSESQRTFQGLKKEIRSKVEQGLPITLSEFDQIVKNHKDG
jgi:hypothetical protein